MRDAHVTINHLEGFSFSEPRAFSLCRGHASRAKLSTIHHLGPGQGPSESGIWLNIYISDAIDAPSPTQFPAFPLDNKRNSLPIWGSTMQQGRHDTAAEGIRCRQLEEWSCLGWRERVRRSRPTPANLVTRGMAPESSMQCRDLAVVVLCVRVMMPEERHSKKEEGN